IENDVTDSTSVAAPAASARRGSRSHWLRRTTLSMRYFDVVGSTRPARRLIFFFVPGGFVSPPEPGAGLAPRLRSALPSPLIFNHSPQTSSDAWRRSFVPASGPTI